MIPFGNETVTMVRRTESTGSDGRTAVAYSTVKLTGCSWHRSTRIYQQDEALIASESITCRIPASQTKPQTGDLLILGDVTVTVTSGAAFRQLIEDHQGTDGAFVVTTVSDNARAGYPLPHYAARS